MNNEVVPSEEFKWLREVNSMVRGEAFKDFGLALTAWRKAQRESRRNAVVPTEPDKCKPRYKKKGKCRDSFRLFSKSGTEFKVPSAHRFSTVRIQGKKPLVFKTCETVEFLQEADIKTCTFSREAGLYYVSICYEKTNRAKTANVATVGIDLGVKTSVSCFDGQNFFEFGLPETLKDAQKRTEKLNKKFSRTQKGSKRHLRALFKVQKAYTHEANIKKDFREKLTTSLADSYNLFKIDDFGFKGTVALGTCTRKLHDVSPYVFKLRLEEKAAERGSIVFYLPKFTPSTRTCSCCGSKKMMKLSDRIYNCPVCGQVLDRDANSAKFAYNY